MEQHFQQRHYEVLAQIMGEGLFAVVQNPSLTGEDAIYEVISLMRASFRNDNSHFDLNRFSDAIDSVAASMGNGEPGRIRSYR